MPLVQSLDLLKRRVTSPVVPPGARRRPREGAVGHRAVGRLRRAPRPVSQRLHGVAAGRRAQRQPRRDAAPLRRVHEDHRDGEAQDGLGARLSGDPDLARARARDDHRPEGRAGVLGLLRVVRRGAAAQSRGSSSASRSSLRAQFLLVIGGARRGGGRVRRLGAPAGTAGALRPRAARPAGARQRGAEVRDVADGADAGDAARRRPAAGQRARHRGEVGRQPVHGQPARHRQRARARGRVVRRGARSAAACFPRSR